MDFSTSNLLSSLFVSCLGAGLFLYGKRAERFPALLIGLVMCIYPYFLGTLAMWGLTGVLLGALYMFRQS